MRLLRRLRYWLQRERFARELDEELALHRELVERDQEVTGRCLQRRPGEPPLCNWETQP